MGKDVFELTADEKKKKFFAELKDLLAGAAFPLMIMIIFSASIISFASAGDMVLRIIVLVLGELALAAAYVLFGKQNGIAAMRKSLQNDKKRALGFADKSAMFKTGEFALYKGFLIPLISCVPFIIFQIIECAYHNTFCDFMLQYAFGWAAYPFRLMGVNGAFNFVWIVPLCSIHAAAYVWGGKIETKRAERAAVVDEVKGKKGEK